MDAQLVPLHLIRAGDNDRKNFDEAELLSLADDIEQHGLISAITLRPVQEHVYRYEIVAGERRFRAYNILVKRDAARWSAIPALIRDLSDEEADDIMLSENLARRQLDPIEEAQAFYKRMQRRGWDARQVAKHFAKSTEYVERRLALLAVLPEAQTLIRHERLQIGHGVALSNLDKNHQLIALRTLTDSKRVIPLAEFTQICSQLEEKQRQAALPLDFGLFAPPKPAPTVDEQRAIAQQLVAAVKICTSFPIEVNGVTIHLSIEHLSTQEPLLDLAALTDALGKAIRLTDKEGG